MLRPSRRQIFGLTTLSFLLLTLPLLIYLVYQVQILRKRAVVLPPEIVVDAQQILGPLPRFWTGLAQGGEEKEPNLDDLKNELRELEPTYIRLDHVFDFYDVVYRRPDQSLGFNWQILDRRINDILNTGATPFLCLSYMPPALSSGDEVALPYDWWEWELLVQKTIEHVSGKRGLNLEGVYYEAWNEPDLFGRFNMGGIKDYRELYYWTVRGAGKVEEVNDFKIGGPAISYLDSDFLPSFLDYVVNNNLRLDFVSWHAYGFDEEKIAKEGQIVSRWLNQYPSLIETEKIVSEWAIESERSIRHGQNVSAAHTAATITKTTEGIDKIFAFEIKDGPDNGNIGWGLFTHESLGKRPKPRYWALWLTKFLKEWRLVLSGEGTYVKALATKDPDESIGLFLANYSPFYSLSDTAVPIIFNRLYNGVYKFKTQVLAKDGEIEIADPKTFTISNGVLSDSIFLSQNTAALLELERISPLLSYTYQGRFGYPGDHAASFNSGGEVVVYPLNNRVTAAKGTIEMWVRSDWGGMSQGERVFFAISPVNGVRLMARKVPIGFSSQLEFGFFEGTASAKTVTANIGDWEKDDWRNLAFVWDNTQGANSYLKIFVDGKLKDTRSGSWRFPLGPTFYLGSQDDDLQKLIGAIDELRISDLPLYKGNFTPPAVPLTADENTIILQHFDGLSNP